MHLPHLHKDTLSDVSVLPMGPGEEYYSKRHGNMEAGELTDKSCFAGIGSTAGAGAGHTRAVLSVQDDICEPKLVVL